MGIIRTTITLVNASDTMLVSEGKIKPEEVRKVATECIVDSGASRLVINEEVREQLGLVATEFQSARLADGSVHFLPVVCAVEIYFENRSTVCRAIVAPRGSSVLLGAIPLQDMDVVLNMKEEKLQVNPESPDQQMVLLL